MHYLLSTGRILGFCETSSARHKGSKPYMRTKRNRCFNVALNQLCSDNFGDGTKYSEADFQRRFKLPHLVFRRVYESFLNQDIFVVRHDATGKACIQPVTVPDGFEARMMTEYFDSLEIIPQIATSSCSQNDGRNDRPSSHLTATMNHRISCIEHHETPD